MGRQRVIVLTDISSLQTGFMEPDDTQSLVRLLLYANELEIEGLVATYTSHWEDAKPEYIHAILDAYEKVQPNLVLHDPNYPSADRLRSAVRCGNRSDGIERIGEGHDTEGSELIVEAALRSDGENRPLWILVWGGNTDLAQALWSAERRLGGARFAAMLSRLRVYSIGDQYGKTGAWIREKYPELFYITCYSAYRGMYKEGETETVASEWLEQHVTQGHGALGEAYPIYDGGDLWGRVKGVKEGDSPSFLYLIPNGLGDPERPWIDSWGGRFAPEAGSQRQFADGPGPESRWAPEAWKTVARWRPAFQNSFQARMDRCILPFASVNHEPIARVDGPAERTVRGGERVTLDASASSDPDGDGLKYSWEVDERTGSDAAALIRLEDAQSPTLTFRAPQVEAPAEVHLLLTVTDDGTPPLCSYRRVVVRIIP